MKNFMDSLCSTKLDRDIESVRTMKYSSKKPKIILVPYPAQGHVTPMLMLATVFSGRGLLPIILTPNYMHCHISSQISYTDEVLLISMPDGLDDDAPRDFFTAETVVETIVPVHLKRVLNDYSCVNDGASGSGVVCMVIDILVWSAIEVGRELGVPVAGFWPAMFATYKLFATIPEMVQNDLISSITGGPKEGSKGCVTNEPLESGEELPWLTGSCSERKGRFKFFTTAIHRARSLKWLIVNSFPEEEPNPIIPKSSTAVFLVGPLNRHSNPGKTLSLREEDGTCLKWLDKQSPDSVVYISFGSWVSPINQSKVRSLAMALLAMRKPFIWVLKTNWRDGLPNGFEAKAESYGRLVLWAPQIEILKHKAVNCYLTHCGWNSINEAIEYRKRLLCFPVAGDQFLNCGYVVKVWRIGVRLNELGEKEVEEGVRKVVEDEEMKGRLMKLHDKIMGEEAKNRVNSNFTAFLNYVNI